MTNVVSFADARARKDAELRAETNRLASELGIKTGDQRQMIKDDELATLLGFDSVREMIECADGKRGRLWIDTCDGQWIKYQQSTTWLFNQNVP